MIPIFEPEFGDNERVYLNECIETGWVSSQGRFIAEFEARFASRANVPFGVATSNCTTALHVALVALGIGPGDEVVCPDLTFIAPANMVRLTGATPVLVDVEPESWCLDPIRFSEAVTSHTKAVIVVHAFGHVADMDPILAIAREHDLRVIEDVAEAPDALYKGRVAGAFGDAACYSFFGNKIMTTGEGGIVLCRDEGLDHRLRVLRDHGMSRERRYHHVALGFNYRMTNMQAAVGLGQLERLDDIHSRRKVQADRYAACFEEASNVRWRPVLDYCQPVHWLSTISLRRAALRDPLLTHLKENGIDGRAMVNPVHRAEHYLADYANIHTPVSNDVSARSLHLPSGTGLGPDLIDRVADTVLAWLAANDP